MLSNGTDCSGDSRSNRGGDITHIKATFIDSILSWLTNSWIDRRMDHITIGCTDSCLLICHVPSLIPNNHRRARSWSIIGKPSTHCRMTFLPFQIVGIIVWNKITYLSFSKLPTSLLDHVGLRVEVVPIKFEVYRGFSHGVRAVILWLRGSLSLQ